MSNVILETAYFQEASPNEKKDDEQKETENGKNTASDKVKYNKNKTWTINRILDTKLPIKKRIRFLCALDGVSDEDYAVALKKSKCDYSVVTIDENNAD